MIMISLLLYALQVWPMQNDGARARGYRRPYGERPQSCEGGHGQVPASRVTFPGRGAAYADPLQQGGSRRSIHRLHECK